MTASLPPTRQLAPGLDVHPLGVRCRSVRPDAEAAVLAALHRAVEYGPTLFATRDDDGAGGAERLVGRVLRAHRELPLRVCVGITHRGTAPHAYAAPHLRHQVEQSADNLGIERVDLCVLPSFDFGPDDRYLMRAIDQLRVLRTVGAIGAIGLRGPHPNGGDGFAPPRVARFLRLFHQVCPDVVVTRFNALTRSPSIDGSDNVVDFAQRHDVGLLLTGPLASGVLAGRPSSRTRDDARVAQALARGLSPLRKRFADEPSSLTRAALRYCLDQGEHTVTLAGFADARDITENYTGVRRDPPPRERRFTDRAFARVRAELETAARARRDAPVPVPSAMRTRSKEYLDKAVSPVGA